MCEQAQFLEEEIDAKGTRRGRPSRSCVDQLVAKSRGWKCGEAAGTRTRDPRLKRPLLYQLSYHPNSFDLCLPRLAGRRAASASPADAGGGDSRRASRELSLSIA